MTLQILDHSWHQVHSYRLHALPAEFTYLDVRHKGWNVAQRPVPDNWCGLISPDDVDVSQYDLAILHLDQWCDSDNNLRALPYRVMNQIARDLPRIVIMHGTPDNAENREHILYLIGDLPVVCNSFQAAREWDGGDHTLDRHNLWQFRAIIHGYDVNEFWSEPLERRRSEVITICSGGSISREYHGIPLIERLRRDVPLIWYGPRGNRSWLPDYYAYRYMLSTSLIYFSPTRRAPMPGARTEAMLSGCCIVTVPGNDVERYVTHGETGFIVETYVDARDVLQTLLAEPEMAWKIGQAGREVARQVFDKDRYVRDWLNVLAEMDIEPRREAG